MKLGVIVLSWNAADEVIACLRSLQSQSRQPDRVIVVDNASADNTVARVRESFSEVGIICNERNLGFAGGMNVGIRALLDQPESPDIIALLNQDTQLDSRWTEAILAPFDEAQVGAVGSKILYADGTIQHAGKYLEWPRAVAQHVGWYEPDRGQHDMTREVEDLTAAAIAFRADALREVGPFDEGYAPAYYEDSDLCWRLRRAGWRLIYTPEARLTHHESLSIRDVARRSRLYNRGRLRFVLKTYPLDAILGPFADSERTFIEQHGRGVEARALRWAYIATIARLAEILHARAEFYPPLTTAEQQAVSHLLLDLKRSLALALHRRAQRTIDQLAL